MNKREYFNKLKDLLEQYLYVFEVGIEASAEYCSLCLRNLMTMNDKEMRSTLTNEYKQYLRNLQSELQIYNFALKKLNKIDTGDMYYVFEKLDVDYESRYEYINDVFENFLTALNFELKDRFYLPRKKFIILDENKINLYKEYLKGFNLDSLKDYMTEEKIYSSDAFDETMKKSKIYDVDIDEYIDIFAVLIKEEQGTLLTLPVLPTIKGDRSFLINIHELTHNALLTNNDINCNNQLVYKEDLAIFYESLYKSRNPFVMTNMHTSELSKRLLSEYKNEPFLEQVEKIKYYSKKNKTD